MKTITMEFPTVYVAEHTLKGKRNPRHYLLIEMVPYTFKVLSDDEFPEVCRMNVLTAKPFTNNIEASRYERTYDLKRDVEVERISLRHSDSGLLMAPVIFGDDPKSPGAASSIRQGLYRGVDGESLLKSGNVFLGKVEITFGKPLKIENAPETFALMIEAIQEGNYGVEGRCRPDSVGKPTGLNKCIVKGTAEIRGARIFPQFTEMMTRTPFSGAVASFDFRLVDETNPDFLMFNGASEEFARTGRRIRDNREIAIEKMQQFIDEQYRVSKDGVLYSACNAPLWKHSFSRYCNHDIEGDSVYAPIVYPSIVRSERPRGLYHYMRHNAERVFGVLNNQFKDATEFLNAAMVSDDAFKHIPDEHRNECIDQASKLADGVFDIRDVAQLYQFKEYNSSNYDENVVSLAATTKENTLSNSLFSVEIVDEDLAKIHEKATGFDAFAAVLGRRLNGLRSGLSIFLEDILSDVKWSEISAEAYEALRDMTGIIGLDAEGDEFLKKANDAYIARLTDNTHYLMQNFRKIVELFPGKAALKDYEIICDLIHDIAKFDPISFNAQEMMTSPLSSNGFKAALIENGILREGEGVLGHHGQEMDALNSPKV